jgi:hypothetical protein
MSDYNCCANCSRALFIILNIIFVLFGSGFIGFGSYLINLGSEHDYDIITGSQFVSGAALLVAAGVFTFAVAVIGIIGAVFMWRPMLLIYILVVMALVVVEIAAGIIGFVFRDGITEEVEERMTEAFLDFRADPSDEEYKEDVNDVVAYVQETFECCGVNGSQDWLNDHPGFFQENGNQPPRECLCEPDSDDNCEMFSFIIPVGTLPEQAVDQPAMYNAWDRGCLEVVEDNLDRIAISIGVIGLVVGIFEIIGIVMAVGLCVCIFKARDDTYV